MRYRSTKRLGPFSAAFRQHGADSHCRLIHGYGLTVRLEFGSDRLDIRNWVVDFGDLKAVKAWCEDNYDHKLIIAEDDPGKAHLFALHHNGFAEVRVMPAVGCEAFAQHIAENVMQWLHDKDLAPRVKLIACEVREHDNNSAIYCPGLHGDDE